MDTELRLAAQWEEMRLARRRKVRQWKYDTVTKCTGEWWGHILSHGALQLKNPLMTGGGPVGYMKIHEAHDSDRWLEDLKRPLDHTHESPVLKVRPLKQSFIWCLVF